MVMWSLKEGEKELKPMLFSNEKTQEDIVKETLDAINKGYKIIFIHGVCGSGKSAIALNIAKEIGKTSIVVPIKNLQKQYEQDYMNKKQVFKQDGSKLKISMITGRNNHKCPYLEENNHKIHETRTIEANANIHDIFKKIKNGALEQKKQIRGEESADNHLIPCKIEIKEKNMATLKEYYKDNPNRKEGYNLNLKYAKRMAVAPACPYWSPILPSELKINLEAKEIQYKSLKDNHTIYARKPGCPYYKQFHSYANSDVIMFNSAQYLLETELGRKPLTEIEIIDECDEFLDNLAAEGSININRLRAESSFLYGNNPEEEKLITALNDILKDIFEEAKQRSTYQGIFPLDQTKVIQLTELFAKNDYLPLIQDEDSYLESCSELCKKFNELSSEAHISFQQIKDRKEYMIKLVTVNLDRVFGNLLSKNKTFVMMSGTLHSPKVLKEIFGIDNFKIIEAETINQGNIRKIKTGLEKEFNYKNLNSGMLTREDYLRALDLSIGMAKKPVIVHVNAFSDLPDFYELQSLGLKNLVSGEILRDKQQQDKNGKLVEEFKQGYTPILFTTRCSRGVDFPYGACNSVVITKFPYPNTQSLFWQILKRQKPNFFWDFYKDKAHRELLQRIYRSVRAKDDHVDLLSPDIRVLESDVV